MSLDLDHVDVTARQETLTACLGQPVLVQLPLVPSYALTVHKTQARVNYNESSEVYDLHADVSVKTKSREPSV